MITKLDVLNKLAEYKRFRPTKVNPTVEDYSVKCVYTDPNDGDSHCIGGQMLVDFGQGHRLPSIDSTNNSGLVVSQIIDTSRVDPGVKDLMNTIQRCADGWNDWWLNDGLNGKEDARPWGVVADLIFERLDVV